MGLQEEAIFCIPTVGNVEGNIQNSSNYLGL